ncbi:MAG: hypothetical protein ACI39E_01415 [Acutalibacteraceae bacterium]
MDDQILSVRANGRQPLCLFGYCTAKGISLQDALCGLSYLSYLLYKNGRGGKY